MILTTNSINLHIKQTEQNNLDSYITVGLSILPVDTIVHVNVHVVD